MFDSALNRITVKASLALRKLGIKSLPILRFKEKFYFLRIMDLVLANSDKLFWIKDDLFVDKQLNFRFHIIKDAYWMDAYYRAQKSMLFYKNNDEVFAKVNGLRFHLPFPSGIIELYETFVDECYGFFNVENQVVLDIGGFIGDTSIYFASKGAKKVISFEPCPPLYEMAAENISLNGLEQKIVLINEAVGAENGFIDLYFNRNNFGGTRIAEESDEKNYKVKMTSILEIFEQLSHVDIVKMDCEGAEWAILPKAKEVGILSKINRIVLEIHGENFEQMVNFLKNESFKIIRKDVLATNLCLVVASRT